VLVPLAAVAAAACHAIAVTGTVQAAVDQAQPCDWVLVPAGTYAERVVVRTPQLRVRGLDRNATFVTGGIDVEGAGDVVENLTVEGGATFGGTAWRGRYLTVAGGISAGGKGSLDHVYASGSLDAGIALNGCTCTVSYAVAERNAVGVSAIGKAAVTDSLVRSNSLGVLLGAGGVVRRSRIEQNDNLTVPASANALRLPWGVGILIANAAGARVQNDLVTSNRSFGVLVEEAPGARIEHTIARGAVYADLALIQQGACFSADHFARALPASLAPWSCTAASPAPVPDAATLLRIQNLLTKLETDSAQRKPRPQPAPPALPTLPDACAGVPAGAACVP
jgi:hypothetical protein